VIGGEGQGMREAVARRCDALLQIPQRGQVASLNASVAGAILLYEALRQRGEKAG
jgi:23S rRNA (guanosine2251-2'-O)-methyltransferase